MLTDQFHIWNPPATIDASKCRVPRSKTTATATMQLSIDGRRCHAIDLRPKSGAVVVESDSDACWIEHRGDAVHGFWVLWFDDAVMMVKAVHERRGVTRLDVYSLARQRQCVSQYRFAATGAAIVCGRSRLISSVCNSRGATARCQVSFGGSIVRVAVDCVGAQ